MTATRRILASLLASGALLLPAAPAHADADVTVTNDRGTGRADLEYRTAMTVRGQGFQVVRGGFGGVYVMFGWVRDPSGGAWRPSRGGLTGQDYRYVPDSETSTDNQGYLRFVAFPGSDTAAEANAVLSARGTFTVDLTVPGPVFESVDRNGDVQEVDCREVTCGVITIGAHGVKNPENETFTPVPFGTVYDTAPPSAVPTTAPAQPADPVDVEVAPSAAPSPAVSTPAAAASVTADRSTAVAGRTLAFTGAGFTPGEQVVAVLDDGVAGLGPLQAGASGEVAGVLPLPLDLEVGTHTLRLTGAASGTEASQNFPVAAGADPDLAAAEGTAELGLVEGRWLFLGFAALVLVAACFAALRRRRREAP